jgi:hypothetical protein
MIISKITNFDSPFILCGGTVFVIMYFIQPGVKKTFVSGNDDNEKE